MEITLGNGGVTIAGIIREDGIQGLVFRPNVEHIPTGTDVSTAEWDQGIGTDDLVIWFENEIAGAIRVLRNQITHMEERLANITEEPQDG